MGKRTIQLLSIALAVAAGFLSHLWWFSGQTPVHDENSKPLYWVAPMDPNYQRDQPGKSPMGMDLIPVYPRDITHASKGSIQLTPTISHGLGVRTAPVILRQLQRRIWANGVIAFNEELLVHMHPRVDGWIDELFVATAGDLVLSGQPLLSLYSPTLTNAQEELLVALNHGQAPMISAAKARLRALHIHESTIAELIKSRAIQPSVILEAPQSGVLTALTVRKGMYVQPGTEMAVIAPTDALWLLGEVAQGYDVSDILGASVTVTLPGAPSPPWHSVIDYVYPALTGQRRTIQFRASLANVEQQLKPGMYVSVTIEPPPSAPVLVIPTEALIRARETDRVVLICQDGGYKSITVEAGNIAGDWVEIRNGLVEGDQVVTSAQFLIDSESSKDSDFQRFSTTSGSTPCQSRALDSRARHVTHDSSRPKSEGSSMDHAMNHGGINEQESPKSDSDLEGHHHD